MHEPRCANVFPARVRALWIGGCALLAVGALQYVLVRPASELAVWPDGIDAPGPFLRLPGTLNQALPSFIHTLAFALLTAAAIGRPSALVPAAIAWGCVNLAFEIGQHPHVAAVLADVIGSGPQPQSLLIRYFVEGTFDVLDLAATALAALIVVSAAMLQQGRART